MQSMRNWLSGVGYDIVGSALYVDLVWSSLCSIKPQSLPSKLGKQHLVPLFDTHREDVTTRQTPSPRSSRQYLAFVHLQQQLFKLQVSPPELGFMCLFSPKYRC